MATLCGHANPGTMRRRGVVNGRHQIDLRWLGIQRHVVVRALHYVAACPAMSLRQ